MTVNSDDFLTLFKARHVLKKMCENPTGPEKRCAEDLKCILTGMFFNGDFMFSEWDTGDKESDKLMHEAPNSYTEYFKPVSPEQIMACRIYLKEGLRAGAGIPNLKVALDELQKIIADEDFDQTVVVEEECTELLKEICKLRRGKCDREHLMEETIDVVTACMVYNQVCGGSLEDLIEKAAHKINRAIKRYETNGDM